MLSKVDGRKKFGENSRSGKLLNDIETIGKALYLDKTRPRTLMSSTASSRSKSVGKTHLPPESKSKARDEKKELMEKEKMSIWSWKGIKALAHVRDRRFNCYFSLHVHSIEGLPQFFDDLSLIVHWKRKDGELVTRPVMGFQGVAEFEEQLMHSCLVYGRSGPNHSAKYEAKHFLLYVSVYGTPELDLGKHRVELTRLLPLTLDELEEERSSGKWTTSYRLSGKAKGGVLNVSFGYEVVKNNRTETFTNKEVSGLRSFRQNSESTVKFLNQIDQSNELSSMRRTGSLPAMHPTSQHSAEDIKDLHEVLPLSKSGLSDSITMLYKKFDEEKFNALLETVKPEVDLESVKTVQPKVNLESFKTVKPEVDLESVETVKPEVELDSVETVKPDLHLSSDAGKGNNVDECEVTEFFITDQGPELASNEQEKLFEDTGIAAHDSSLATYDDVEVGPKEETQHHFAVQSQKDELLVSNCNSSETDFCTKESLMKELESALSSVSDLAKEGLDSQEDESELLNSENQSELQSSYKMHRKGKSLSLDDVTDTVASEFFDLLGIEQSPVGLSSESEPESPRERLLRQFEKDTLASGCSLFNFDIDEDQSEMVYDVPTGSDWRMFCKDYDPSLAVQTSEEMPKIEAEAMGHKTRASMLEDLETESLMREWGLNEKTFQCSPPGSLDGFGSPIDMPPEIPDQSPSLGEGLGPFIQTKDGGFLRSMSPALFMNAKNGGSLIMQVSSPVVMPAEMGSGVMDILQHLASVGIEKLSMQANKLMPLEDVTGKTMQQIAWEAAPSLEGPERQDLFLQHESGNGQSISGEHRRVGGKPSEPRNRKFESNSVGSGMDSEYVSLGDLAPLAMDKIEALAIEGLRIQSGMSEEDAPANISPQSIGEFSALEGKRVGSSGSIGLEGAGGLQLLDIKDNGGNVDGLMGLSLTLDEWMRLDSGEIDDEDCVSERTSKLLAAHHAKCTNLIVGRSKGEKRRGKSRNGGLLGNNFTVALMVQLRDPLRNYEPVGTPMLALIQVERVFVPPKPKIYGTVSVRESNEEDDEPEPARKDVNEEPKEEIVPEEELIPQFKITEVHVAGLKTEPGKKKLWGTSTQQQSGSRWLLANGMGKKNKHPLLKSKAGAKSSSTAASPDTTKVQPGETLWSISSRVHGTGAKWKELAKLNPHIRNPNVILPNETIRLR